MPNISSMNVYILKSFFSKRKLPKKLWPNQNSSVAHFWVATQQLRNTALAPNPGAELVSKEYIFFTPASTHLMNIETDTFPPRPPPLWTSFISAAYIQNIPDPAGRRQGRSACELWKCDSLETDIRCLLSRLASRRFPFVFASCWCELCRPPSLLLIQRGPGPARPGG